VNRNEICNSDYPDEIKIAARNFEGLVADGDSILVFAYTGIVGRKTMQEGGSQTRIMLLIML